MIAFIFIFNVFFCSIFSFLPIWALCVKMRRMMMEYRGPRGPQCRRFRWYWSAESRVQSTGVVLCVVGGG